ncbi:MAG TPA: alpha-glucosidase family protein [Woeseiaceae bacterium]|nr:alpha-glucosidase family protein [Woeseiaceae bacterium]
MDSSDLHTLQPAGSEELDTGGNEAGRENEEWWRGAVIYQVYPRSFMDSNNDGVGDLQGIIDKLGYIADLGVDAVWISPFFESPMKDFGYDVSDYRMVDPIFGDLDDFDRLVATAHRLGLRIMIDQVLSHSSDQHAWFAESRSSRDNAKANWYVWADPKADGTPPNNWLSVFGGPAWQWEPRREQYYLHNFLASQPDLNYHEPEVVAQMLAEVDFWLQRGVDGMRLDAINFCYHDRLLRDNPARPGTERVSHGYRTDNPYAWQYHRYDNTQPENLAFLQQLRQLSDGYSEVVLLGEVTGEDPIDTMVEYTSGSSRLHMAYNFELLADDFSLEHIRNAVESLENSAIECWPCRSIGNHDVPRVTTRWGGKDGSQARSKLLNALLLSLKGSVCSYQGDELGLTEAKIAAEDIRDPYGMAFWPLFKGRDGCRTPMPWTVSDAAFGFTGGKPWLPVPAEHRDKAVEKQLQDPDSVLQSYRRFVRWRRAQPALSFGDIRFLESPENTLAFTREYGSSRVLAFFNFNEKTVGYDLPLLAHAEELAGHGFPTARLLPARVEVAGYAAFFATV